MARGYTAVGHHAAESGEGALCSMEWCACITQYEKCTCITQYGEVPMNVHHAVRSGALYRMRRGGGATAATVTQCVEKGAHGLAAWQWCFVQCGEGSTI